MPLHRLASPGRHLTILVVMLAMIIAGVAVFVVRQSVDPLPAAAKPAKSPPAKHAVGLTLRGQWFGTWKTASGRGFCIDFDRSDPNSKGSKPLSGNVPGMNAEESALVKFVANKYGGSASKTDTAAAAIYVWKVQNTDRFDKYYARMLRQKAIPTAVQKRLAVITAEAKLHGPYKLTMKIGAGYVGQQINGWVSMRTAKGRAVPGMAITMKHNANAKLVRVGRTDTHGKMTFVARVMRPGAVRVNARIATPSSRSVWITQPTAGHQRLVQSGRVDWAFASAASQKTPVPTTLESSCSADCHGVAPVKVTAKNPCGSMSLRQYVYSNGALIKNGTFVVKGCAKVTKKFNLPDAAVVTTRSCYLDSAGRCIGTPIASGIKLTVVCPPWVEYSYTGACPCATGKNLTYTVWVPASARRSYTVTLRQLGTGGPNLQTLKLTSGQRLSFKPVTFVKNQQVSLSFSVLGVTHQLDQMTTNF